MRGEIKGGVVGIETQLLTALMKGPSQKGRGKTTLEGGGTVR